MPFERCKKPTGAIISYFYAFFNQPTTRSINACDAAAPLTTVAAA
jgi:hypothetical protein